MEWNVANGSHAMCSNAIKVFFHMDSLPPPLNLGEWKTQLSRPQLRALRHKQRKSKEAGETANQLVVDVGSDSNGDSKQSEVCLCWAGSVFIQYRITLYFRGA